MSDVGRFLSSFFANVSILFLLMYAASLIYKYAAYRLSPLWKEVLFIALAIISGWTTMHYGFRFSETVIFDLRFLAVIIASMIVQNPLSILTIGIGLGLARLSFGINQAAVVGCTNVIFMSLLCMAIIVWAKRKQVGFYARMTIFILVVNTMNVVYIAAFGVIPTREYLFEMAPGSLIISLVLSFLYMFMLREFMLEANRKQQLELSHIRLEEQYRISEEKGEELRLAKQKLEEKNEQLVLASQYKSEFLANMSHELRTPLNAMLVLSQILEENAEGRMSEEEVRYAGLIHTSGKGLFGLINEVLDLSKIEAGHMDVEPEEFNVRELLLQMEQTYKPLALQKGIALSVTYPEGNPEYMYADRTRLRQIIQNMMANALKFTEQGAVHLSAYPVSSPSNTEHGSDKPYEWLAFTVEDTGIGIPAEKQSIIFEAFHQADGTTSRKYGGTGLGLSISKQFAALMGGFIEMESQEGQGSRFTLYLPWLAPG